jgi:hypothetical protein
MAYNNFVARAWDRQSLTLTRNKIQQSDYCMNVRANCIVVELLIVDGLLRQNKQE